MNYCIYLRKSRKDVEAETHGEGETLARHERTLLELAKAQGLTITQIYREIVSGETIAARPVMTHLLHEIECGMWAGVLVMEVERLARGDTIDQGTIAQAFKLSNTKIITPLKTYDPENEFDEEYFEFGLFMSRREYKTITRRMQQGRMAAAREGKFIGNRPAYGYEKVKLKNEKGYSLKPIPEQATVVKMIFDLYTLGEEDCNGNTHRLGTSLIAKRLNTLNFRTQTGHIWTQQAVRDILINPVYAGKIRINYKPEVKRSVDGKIVTKRQRLQPNSWEVVQGMHEEIVSEAQFKAAQAILSNQRPTPIHDRGTIKNPLSGLVTCAKCGRKMVRKPLNYKIRTDYLMCPGTNCDNASAPINLVELRVLQVLSNWLTRYKVQWKLDENDAQQNHILSKEAALKTQQKALDKLIQQRNSTYDLLEQGIYTKDVFLERNKMLAKKIEDTTTSINALSHEIAQAQERAQATKTIIPKVEHVLDLYWTAATPADKNTLLKSVIQGITYDKAKGGRWKVAADDFKLTLYPKIPKQDLS